MARTDPQRVFSSADERLAHHINAYNAMAMFAVLENDIHHTNTGLTKVKFFFLQRYRIANSKKSLYKYEKEIRALGDPRIHFALNCMSISCPILPQVPFAASSLNKVLDFFLALIFFSLLISYCWGEKNIRVRDFEIL